MPDAGKRWVFWAVLGVLLGYALLDLANSIAWINRPFPGFKVHGDAVVDVQTPGNWSGPRHGLHPLDRVTSLNGTPLRDAGALYRAAETSPVGTTMIYGVERTSPSGQLQHLSLRIPTQRFHASDWLTLSFAFWIIAVACVALAASLLYLRPQERAARWGFVAYMAGGLFFLGLTGDLQGFGLARLADAFYFVSMLVMTYSAVIFYALFPRPLFTKRFGIFATAAGILWGGVMLVCLVCERDPRVYSVAILCVVLCYVMSIFSPCWALFAPGGTPVQRAQARVLLCGFLLGYLPDAAPFLEGLPFFGPQWRAIGGELLPIAILYVLSPLAIAYAILRHKLFGIELVFKRTVAYTLLAMALSLVYMAVAAATQALLGQQTHLSGMLAAACVAVGFAPLRDRIKRGIDKAFFRIGYRFEQVVSAFHDVAHEAPDDRTLREALVGTLEEALHPAWLLLCARAEAGSEVLASRGTPQPGAADAGEAGLVVALGTRGEALLIGPRKSDLPYGDRDRALIDNLVRQAASRLDFLAEQQETRRQAAEIAALKQAEAMQNQFLNLVSHELRTPLSVILGGVSFLSRFGGPLDARSRAQLARMQASAGDLVSFVNDLLDAGQLQAGVFRLNPTPLTLAAIAREVVAEQQAFASEHGQQLRLEGDETVAVLGDRQRLRQVFRNLIHNAIRHGPAGQPITVRLAPEAGQVRCAVSNGAPGLTPEALQKLFQRFGALAGEAGDQPTGVGLGLFIAKALVEAHGGEIGVESSVAAGSTFWFTLPAAPEPGGVSAAAAGRGADAQPA